jgi:DNA-binding transcriptional LysR family regulator
MVGKHIRDLDLTLLITLEALLRLGSVTRVAEELDVTQSAVSHSLRKMRTLFADPLFVKGKLGVVPTDRAKLLAEPVRRILSIARESLFDEGSFDPALIDRVVTICTSDMGEVSIMPLLVERLHAISPLCRIRTVGLNMADIRHGLEAGDVDLVLSGPLKMPPAILQQRIYTHTFSVIVAPSSDVRGPLTLEQYERMEHVSITPALSGQGHGNLAWQALGIVPRVHMTTPHMTTVPWLIARAPKLIATVPTKLADMFTSLGIVRAVDTEFELPSLPVYQYWHRRFYGDRFATWFRAFVRETVESSDLNIE